MARKFHFMLALTSLCITQISADWNILNHRGRTGFKSSSSSNNNNNSLKNYCESWRINVELNNIRNFKAVPEECVAYIKHYMTSSQYESDCERAIEEVKVYLSSCCHLQDDGKNAWIFDVDDTLLSTVPFHKKHGFRPLNATLLEEWMKESKAPALEHSLHLFHQLRDKGVKIFLISSRSEILRSATVDNLIDVGYHGWSSLVLRGFEDESTNLQEYKCKARKRLVDEGYRIWGVIGDQWSSIEGLPTARRTFKLPNSMYYLS